MKRIRTLIVVLIAINSPFSLLCNAGNSKWYLERIEAYQSAKDLLIQEQIPEYGVMMGLKDLYKNYSPLNQEQSEIFELNQTALLRIPGHAEYYGNRIMEAYQDYKEPGPSRKPAAEQKDYGNESMYGFQTLSQLPSAETVKVLGEMLSEEWESSSKPEGFSRGYMALGKAALRALATLPFVDPPTSRLLNYPQLTSNLPLWQKWYSEVKSGQRSFAFLGQNVSYHFKLDGTVETTLRDASKDRRDPPLSPVKQEKAARQPPHDWIVAAMIAGFLLLVFAVASYLRKKKAG